MGARWLQPGLADSVDELGRGTEHGEAFLRGIIEQTLPSGAKGEPSRGSSVAPLARPEASQFHIIQPQVVK
jgi:hypothetical protein